SRTSLAHQNGTPELDGSIAESGSPLSTASGRYLWSRSAVLERDPETLERQAPVRSLISWPRSAGRARPRDGPRRALVGRRRPEPLGRQREVLGAARTSGTSPVARWLGRTALNAGGAACRPGLISGGERSQRARRTKRSSLCGRSGTTTSSPPGSGTTQKS